MLELRIGQSVRAGDVDELPRAPPDAPCGKSASGAGAGADRHPVRSGQRADGRNRNENPVAGRGPAPDALHRTCRNRGAHQTLATRLEPPTRPADLRSTVM